MDGYITTDYKGTCGGCGRNSYGSVYSAVAGSYKHNNEPAGSINVLTK
jgi:hypothetical protein